MQILSKSSKDEMVALFLKEELNSKRFRDTLLGIIKKANIDESLILNYNLKNANENKIRKLILKEYRGYENNTGIFENFPKNIEWFWAELSLQDILNIKYIDYDYWVELTNGTRYVEDSKENILKGKEIFGVSNQPFIDGANYLKQGKKFDPIILLASKENNKELIVLEGHSRLTSMILVPESIRKIRALIGFVGKEELYKWNKY